MRKVVDVRPWVFAKLRFSPEHCKGHTCGCCEGGGECFFDAVSHVVCRCWCPPALHFHHSGNNVQNGVVAQNSFHHNHQRCLTIHDTNSLSVHDNVGYETVGHCFFLEDASEELNVVDHNLAANVRG